MVMHGIISRTISPLPGLSLGRGWSAGISDDKQQLCFALALWNGKDPIIKERLFGLTNSESNHGEDVKEYYFYLDSTPTHSYMKYLYKYPQAAFPYEDLVKQTVQEAGMNMNTNYLIREFLIRTDTLMFLSSMQKNLLKIS